MKIKHNNSETQSKDLTAENIEQLKKLFPNIVEEGKVNFEVLRQLLGDEVVSEQEYYRFTWPGKHQARQEALKSSTGTLRPAKEESVDWDNTQNLYIEGDNLEVLKLLQKSYFNKVKMIYIDPPYNTGKDFVYKDNYKDNLAEYNQKFNRTDAEGNVLSSETNNEGNARYHSNWLNMMYPRLQLARTLLKDDGVIFISIDDNEDNNLRRICDEIFGEENYVTKFDWRKKTGANDAKDIAIITETILLYAKNHTFTIENDIWERDEDSINQKRYKLSDEYVEYRGKHYLDTLDRGGLQYSDSMNFGIEAPDGGVIFPNGRSSFINDGWTWKWGQEKVKWGIENGFLEFVKSNKSKGSAYTIKYKVYQYVDNEGKERRKVGRAYSNLIINPINQQGKSDFSNLFNGISYFSNPKPIKLIQYFINTINDEPGIILDFFAGSSTTAHAVMDLNKEDILEGKDSSTNSEQAGNRKYIMVQLPEPTDEKSEAYKAGYKTIAEIGKERIRRAAHQIKEELKDQPEVLEQLDLGFKVFKLDSSNIHTWDTAPEELENNLFREEVIKGNRSAEDVLYEVLLKYGLDLTYPIEETTLDQKKIYSVGAGQLIFCLDDGVTRDTAQAIIDWAKEDEIINPKVVFKDAGFTNDVEKTNLIQLFKTHGITDVKSI